MDKLTNKTFLATTHKGTHKLAVVTPTCPLCNSHKYKLINDTTSTGYNCQCMICGYRFKFNFNK